jgi:hypothetical protein
MIRLQDLKVPVTIQKLAVGAFSLRAPEQSYFPILWKFANESYKREGKLFMVSNLS